MSNHKGNGFLDFAVVGAAIMLYVRTAEVLSYFSPIALNKIVGFDVSFIYGNASAIFIEGVILFLHFSSRAKGHTPAEVVKWSLLAISGICQIYDGFLITDSLAQQSDTLKFVFQYGVPILPLLIVVMILWIGQLPESQQQRKPFIGLKNIPNSLSWIWDGGNKAPNKPANKAPNTPKVDEPKQNP
jgi:hypothetical protein